MMEPGQTPYLQFGEVQWWYFPDDGSGMPYYDAYTTSTFHPTYGSRDDCLHDERRQPVAVSAGDSVPFGIGGSLHHPRT